jgi:hypothetical protein
MDRSFYTPAKIGLLAVITSYFLFTLHGMFTLSWIGEWEPLGEPFRTIIFVEDISATVCLAFRFLASIIAFSAIIVYFVKKDLNRDTLYKIVRWVLVFEGIYWLGLLTTAGYSAQGFLNLLLNHRSLNALTNSLFLSVIPTVMEAVVLPIILFIFAFKVNPNKPIKSVIKWGFITGFIFVVVFWLSNSSIWISVVQSKGVEYLWQIQVQINGVSQIVLHPEHLVSFVISVFGLAGLTVYTGYLAKQSVRIEALQGLKMRRLGAVVLALGAYFLWNYFSWVLFAGNVWNDWYAWFLGHNMDLWMLSLPMLGLPLIFFQGAGKENQNSKGKLP